MPTTARMRWGNALDTMETSVSLVGYEVMAIVVKFSRYYGIYL